MFHLTNVNSIIIIAQYLINHTMYITFVHKVFKVFINFDKALLKCIKVDVFFQLNEWLII